MTEGTLKDAKRKWKTANNKRRELQKTARNIMFNTPPSTPGSGTPLSPRSRVRRQVGRDRSFLYKNNVKLQEKLETLMPLTIITIAGSQ